MLKQAISRQTMSLQDQSNKQDSQFHKYTLITTFNIQTDALEQIQ